MSGVGEERIKRGKLLGKRAMYCRNISRIGPSCGRSLEKDEARLGRKEVIVLETCIVVLRQRSDYAGK